MRLGLGGDSFSVLVPESGNMNFPMVLTDGTLTFYVETAVVSRPPKSLEFRRCQPNFH